MIIKTQMPQAFRDIIDEQVKLYQEGQSITNRNDIPETTEIPIGNPRHWLKIPDVICVFVDMKGSTQLSATSHDRSTAGAYQLFTGTAVRIFSAFDTPYIDVRGDGVFGLFNNDQVHRALAAAVTFKTFAEDVFVPTVKKDLKLDVGAHYGIDQKTVLVRKLGLKRVGGRTDRQNEVWAGKPVNMASKLAAVAAHKELIVSDRYFDKLTDDRALLSCGCSNGVPGSTKVSLWKELDVSTDNKFDFKKGYVLSSRWCGIHGEEFCNALLSING
jgi:class 3 adenylate cyclase